MKRASITIIGGGIVGLATAYQLIKKQPNQKICLIEKEAELAFHQTGRNSGVLHSGIYYRPGTLKAENCKLGKNTMVEFCRKENIPYELCGKVIVAVEESEIPRLLKLHERGIQNQIPCELINKKRLKELEPHTAGIQAIHLPESGIVDYKAVCEKLAEIIRNHNGEILKSTRAIKIQQNSTGCLVETTQGDIESDLIINCAGLQSDYVTKMSGQKPEVRIIPFRGEYFKLKEDAKHLCKNLIYPVPDIEFPFLGVHYTRMINGDVECGPNAVLAFAREGYHKTDIRFRELAQTLTYPGFLKLAGKHWKMGLGEMWRSLNKNAFVNSLQRLIPEIRKEDLEIAPAGIRAQALSSKGELVEDFLIQENQRVINVCNAPSPAATASLNIGKLIAKRI